MTPRVRDIATELEIQMTERAIAERLDERARLAATTRAQVAAMTTAEASALIETMKQAGA